MNAKEVRLECYKIAGEVQGIFSALKTPRLELASEFARFCETAGSEDDDLYVAAIRVAMSEADRRATPASVIEQAKLIIEFTSPTPPKAEQGKTRQGRGRGKNRNTSR